MYIFYSGCFKKIFNDSLRYEIKLSSEDITKNVPILNEEKPVKKKKTILFPLLISLSSLTLASLIIGSIFVINSNKENNDYNSLLSPANNKYLDAQLLSFKAFSSNNTSSLLILLIFIYIKLVINFVII